MGRQRTGSIVEKSGKLYARVQFTDQEGQKKDIWRRAESRKDARSIIKDLLREVDDHGEETLDTHGKSFGDLAAYFEEHYLKPAEYLDGRKIGGYRASRLDDLGHFLLDKSRIDMIHSKWVLREGLWAHR